MTKVGKHSPLLRLPSKPSKVSIGDKILQIDSKPISTMADVNDALRSKLPGDKVGLGFVGHGARFLLRWRSSLYVSQSHSSMRVSRQVKVLIEWGTKQAAKKCDTVVVELVKPENEEIENEKKLHKRGCCGCCKSQKFSPEQMEMYLKEYDHK